MDSSSPEITDLKKYQSLQEQQSREWEQACLSCGACCGSAEGDPCEYLSLANDGKYFCRIYENRFGLHKTRSGREFQCVPLRNILHKSWPGDGGCGYKKCPCAPGLQRPS